ncbi:MAG: hypothetical protein AAF531_23135 [Actinomycetota bacterium]
MSSVRPDVAANLQAIHSQIGDVQLDSLLEPSADIPIPDRTPGYVLEHITGLAAGGSIPVEVGSYRIGRSSSSVLLDSGRTTDPRFGLRISPGGEVTLHPSPDGLLVDGVPVVDAVPLQINQTITVGNDRFVLRPRDRLGVSRGPGTEESGRPMPTRAKGRAVDQKIIDWVEGRRNQTLRNGWNGLVDPAEVHRRITDNVLFSMDADAPTFGHGLIGTADLPFEQPVELADANRATQEEAEARFTTLANAPIVVDLTTTSLAIIGERDRTKAAATWLALSLAATHSPADLAIAVEAPADPGFWHWLDRFPHVEAIGDALTTVVISDERRAHLVKPRGTIGILDPTAEVPQSFGALLQLTDHSATFTDRTTGRHVEGVTAIGMTQPVALERSMMVGQHLLRRASVAGDGPASLEIPR